MIMTDLFMHKPPRPAYIWYTKLKEPWLTRLSSCLHFLRMAQIHIIRHQTSALNKLDPVAEGACLHTQQLYLEQKDNQSIE